MASRYALSMVSGVYFWILGGAVLISTTDAPHGSGRPKRFVTGSHRYPIVHGNRGTQLFTMCTVSVLGMQCVAETCGWGSWDKCRGKAARPQVGSSSDEIDGHWVCGIEGDRERWPLGPRPEGGIGRYGLACGLGRCRVFLLHAGWFLSPKKEEISYLVSLGGAQKGFQHCASSLLLNGDQCVFPDCSNTFTPTPNSRAPSETEKVLDFRSWGLWAMFFTQL